MPTAVVQQPVRSYQYTANVCLGQSALTKPHLVCQESCLSGGTALQNLPVLPYTHVPPLFTAWLVLSSSCTYSAAVGLEPVQHLVAVIVVSCQRMSNQAFCPAAPADSCCKRVHTSLEACTFFGS